jgi:hypothetical protein
MDEVIALRSWAVRCRQFATTLFDKTAAAAIECRAREFEAEAEKLEAGESLDRVEK